MTARTRKRSDCEPSHPATAQVSGIAVRAFRGSKAVADILVGLDAQGNLRVVCTADGKGDGDHVVALFPESPAEEMVKHTICDLALKLTPSIRRTSLGDQ